MGPWPSEESIPVHMSDTTWPLRCPCQGTHDPHPYLRHCSRADWASQRAECPPKTPGTVTRPLAPDWPSSLGDLGPPSHLKARALGPGAHTSTHQGPKGGCGVQDTSVGAPSPRSLGQGCLRKDGHQPEGPAPGPWASAPALAEGRAGQQGAWEWSAASGHGSHTCGLTDTQAPGLSAGVRRQPLCSAGHRAQGATAPAQQGWQQPRGLPHPLCHAWA